MGRVWKWRVDTANSVTQSHAQVPYQSQKEADMRTPDGWSLGVLIGLPVAILITLVALIALALFIRGALLDDEGLGFEYGMGATVCGAVLIVTLGVALFGYYPYSSEFHRYYKVTGNVERVSHRQISDGTSMSERYVLVIGGEAYGVDDTRASLVREGDHVTLKCKKEFVYSSESGWACNWGGK